ncbi:MAG TPA: hypothetical protein PK188_01085, partial [Thermosynergistes sp.]|nr:hypothetical protein [Thermosynergistes sp.]
TLKVRRFALMRRSSLTLFAAALLVHRPGGSNRCGECLLLEPTDHGQFRFFASHFLHLTFHVLHFTLMYTRK